MKLKIGDVVAGADIRNRATVIQQKTNRPVQFELTADVRATLLSWLERRGGSISDFLFPSRVDHAGHMSTRQYARLVDEWVTAIGLRKAEYGTHSLRRTKAAMIYRATGNIRAIQILLGHTKIENTVRYLGVDVEDALLLAERTEICFRRRSAISLVDRSWTADALRSLSNLGWKADIALSRERPEDCVMAHKVCPVVTRNSSGLVELLAFRHPSAGKQLVKGSIEEDEAAPEAALRELEEESGINTVSGLLDLGAAPIGDAVWHFFSVTTDGLPDCWTHQTRDDFDHVFEFFWHPLADDLDDEWHSQFHEALDVIRLSIPH